MMPTCFHVSASQRATEQEVLQSADMVRTTCVGAGEARLTSFRFRQGPPLRATFAAVVCGSSLATHAACMIAA